MVNGMVHAKFYGAIQKFVGVIVQIGHPWRWFIESAVIFNSKPPIAAVDEFMVARAGW